MTPASVLLALGLGLSWAAEPVQPPAPPQEQTFGVPLFTEGLHTRYSANSIPDNALTEALNVLIDEDVDGVVVRRPGYAKCNATAITGAQTVRGLWQFDASDGTKYHVAVSSWSFYEHDGDCAWTVIPGLGGAGSEDLEWDCVQALGKFWCTNGSKGIYWDGTSTKTVSGMPAGTLIDTFRNRILVANVASNQSRLYLSGELDGEDWTVPSSPVSTSPAIIAIGGVNDGLSLTCLMGAYQDTYIIGKRDSLSALYGFDRRNFAVREVSREVGCIEDRTVKEKQNSLYWLSKRGVERMRGTVIDRVSDPVRNLVDTIIATAGNLRTVTDTTQADFEAGNLTVNGARAPLSATISPGNVVASTFAASDDSYAEFLATTRTNLLLNAGGTVVLDSTITTVDNFTDGDYTASPVWNVTTGACSASSNYLRGANSSFITPCIIENSDYSLVSGTWQFVNYINVAGLGDNCNFVGFTYNEPCWQYRFMDNGGGDFYFVGVWNPGSGQYASTIGKSVNGFLTNLASSSGYKTDAAHSWTVQKTTFNVISLYIDGVFVSSASDSAITASVKTSAYLKDAAGIFSYLDDIAAPIYYSTGNLISRTFDTGFSTPIGGIFTATVSYPTSETGTYFDIRSSSSPNNDLWTAFSASSDSLKISELKRYWQYRARFNTSSSTRTPTLSLVGLSAATTGQFISQCRNPGTSITSWGRFSCGDVPYGGSFSFAVSTAIACHAATRSTATWNSQIDGSVIAINTAPYVAYRVTMGSFPVFYSTANPTIQECTIEWNEGETRPPAAASVYRDRYHLAYTSSTASGAHNDHQLVLDSNDKWVLWDGLNCYSLGIYERKLYCGASTDSGQVWLMDTGTADDGSAFTSRFKTKAYSFGRPDIFKEFREFGAELEPEPDSSYSISTNWRYYVDRGTTSYSIGPVDLGEDSGYLLWGRMPFGTGEAVRGRYLQLEGEVSGTNSPFRFYGGLLKWRPLRQD